MIALRAANVLFGLLFVFSTIVQWNDPDPVRWMLVYAAAAGACTAAAFGRNPRLFSAGLGLVAGGWAAVWGLGTHLQVPFGTALSDWGMHSGGSEELRETLGLVLVAGWMAVLTAWPRAR